MFSWSYRALGPGASRLFRLLSLHPGPDIGAAAAAALSGVAEPETKRLAAELAEGHLLEEPVPGRYRFHDLMRVYAAERAEADEPSQDRAEATDRLLSWYLQGAVEAAGLLAPGQGRGRGGESRARSGNRVGSGHGRS